MQNKVSELSKCKLSPTGTICKLSGQQAQFNGAAGSGSTVAKCITE